VANAAPGDRVLGRTLKGSREFDSSTYNLNLSSTVDRLIDFSTDTDLYDPLTIQRLRAMQEEAQPRTNPTDIDPYLTRRVAERALAIQSGRTIGSVLEKSELRSTFREIKSTMSSIQSWFRYSIQDRGNGLTISKRAKGKKLVELNVDLNLKEGLTPHLRIGDSVRFRMDDSYKTPMLEYGITW
jgi:hypothetical protein